MTMALTHALCVPRLGLLGETMTTAAAVAAAKCTLAKGCG